MYLSLSHAQNKTYYGRNWTAQISGLVYERIPNRTRVVLSRQ
uniref:Uncharacterized protein n=1 Tax=Anguilla anguilla TaxID=7936 RepID=A0A0E9U078_ANGAN